MENIYTDNLTNALIINNISSPVIQLSMIRYEVLFDFLSEEPNVINVKKKENDNVVCLEQIFRTRRWGNNTSSSSLSIYSSEREWESYEQKCENFEGEIVIREVNWDMKSDVAKIKSCSKMEKSKMLQAWPKVNTKNYWIRISECNEIIKSLIDFDNAIKNNVLTNREDTFVDWKNIEIKRLFNWGCIHSIWSPQKENLEIEAKIAKIKKCAKDIIEKIDYSIYSMDLDFSIEPTSYKNIITRLT